jgi:tetratricopeptide (TPR) repeat protein
MDDGTKGRVQALVASSGRSAELARALREQPIELDVLTRARMEKAVVGAFRLQASASAAMGSQPDRRRFGRWSYAACLAVSALVGGVFAFHGADPGHGAIDGVGAELAGRSSIVPASFELRIGDAAVQSGPLDEGQALESGQHGRIAVDLGSARLDMQPSTQLRVTRLSSVELAVSLLAGKIDVEFHPDRRAGQRLRIETPSARVLVVGTRFGVAVDSRGDSDIEVTQGVVEVVPRSGAATQRIAAGGRSRVRADDGDQQERAVREAIEQQISRLPVESAATPHQATEPGRDLQDADVRVASAIDRLQSARQLLREGQHRAARTLLRAVTLDAVALRFRVEAWTLTAESFTVQGDTAQAAAAYRRADELAPKHAAGDNARFALARLLERHAGDRAAASAAYRRYLELAPDGALAAQARQALCRLGSALDCD